MGGKNLSKSPIRGTKGNKAASTSIAFGKGTNMMKKSSEESKSPVRSIKKEPTVKFDDLPEQ